MKDLEGNFKFKKKSALERQETACMQAKAYRSRQKLGAISDGMAFHHRPIDRKTKNG